MSSELDVVLDCETDGLAPTKIHMLGYQIGGEYVHTESADCFNAWLDSNRGKGYTLYGHNSIVYDFRVLSDLWGCDFSGYQLGDTLVLSRLSSPSRDGGHSLAAWGERLGFPKGDFHDWDNPGPEMATYMKQDVAVTVKVLAQVKKELEGFSPESVQLEYDTHAIIDQQIRNGWLLDQGAVFDLLALLKEKKFELEDEVHKRFVPLCTKVSDVRPKYKKDGGMSVVGLKYLGDGCLKLCGGEHTRVDYPEFNLGSRKQIGERLQQYGWKPLKFTETGQPIVSEEELKDVTGIPEALLIADYLTVVKRIAMAQSWLDAVEDDGRVHGYVDPLGAITNRMTHSSPNMGQVTAGRKIYGKEMRAAWIAKDGYKIVGVDAEGLELRLLAHYMNDPTYTAEVVDGDIHTANQHAAGLATRDEAKTFIYAFLYGAGDEKIGSIAGQGRTAGRRLKAQFLSNTPSLKDLRERVGDAARRGYLVGIDGRRVGVRSAHAALNTLLQSAGAVVMKQALVFLDRSVRAHGLDGWFVGNIHDEIQSEVLAAHAEKFGQLAAYSIVRAGEHLKLRCPMAGKYQIGNSWLETH